MIGADQSEQTTNGNQSEANAEDKIGHSETSAGNEANSSGDGDAKTDRPNELSIQVCNCKSWLLLGNRHLMQKAIWPLLIDPEAPPMF